MSTLLQTLRAASGRVSTFNDNAGLGNALEIANTVAGTKDGSQATYDGINDAGDGFSSCDSDLRFEYTFDPATAGGRIEFVRIICRAKYTQLLASISGTIAGSISGTDVATQALSTFVTDFQHDRTTDPADGTPWTNAKINGKVWGGFLHLVGNTALGAGEVQCSELTLEVWGTVDPPVPLKMGIVHPMRRIEIRNLRSRREIDRTSTRVASGFVMTAGYETFERSLAEGCPVECYRFVSGATEFRYTSADETITLATGAYAPEVVVRDSADFSQEDTAGNITVRLGRSNPVALLGVSYVPPTPVFLTIYRKHRGDPETIIHWQGRVVSWSFNGPEATLTCAPISQIFRRRVPAIAFESQCNWHLYGPGCTVAKASFKDSGTVSAVSGVNVNSAVAATRASGWFRNGWLEIATGERRFIVDHVGDLIVLMNKLPALAVGTAIDLYAGCDRTEAVCSSKFSNLVNHLGFPRVPTRNPYGGAIS